MCFFVPKGWSAEIETSWPCLNSLAWTQAWASHSQVAGPHCTWTSGQSRCGSQVSTSIKFLCLEASWQRRGRRAVSWILPFGTAFGEASGTWYHTNIVENPDLAVKHLFNKPPPMYFQKELYHEDILLLFIVKPLKSHNVPTVPLRYTSYHKSFLF